MRFLVKISTMILLLPIYAGCQREQERLNPWIGQHYSNLLGSWGAPRQVIDDGKGGKILIYEEDHTHISSTSITKANDDYVSIDPSERWGYIRKKIFRTDQSGIVISVSVKDDLI